jgi:DNA-binding transcriptional MocR family regulator
VASDEEGIRPDALEDCLANWPKDKKFPKCIYTMPVGANPGIAPLHSNDVP